MGTLSERLAKNRKSQVKSLVTQRQAAEDVSVATESTLMTQALPGLASPADLLEFHRYFPVMAEFWNYDKQDKEAALTQWTTPEMIKSAISLWRMTAEVCDIWVPPASLQAELPSAHEGKSPVAKNGFTMRLLDGIARDREDDEWISSIIELFPNPKRPEILKEYGTRFQNESLREGDRRQQTNLWLLEQAEAISPEKLEAVQRRTTRMKL